jgi:hypothetical protein
MAEVCRGCGNAIDGPYISAFGHSWHRNHLNCRICGGDFTNRPMYEGKDCHPYCKEDYIKTFAPKCNRCGEAILGKVLSAMGKPWHPHHFTCAKCDTPLVEKGKYGAVDGQPYCPIHTPLTPQEQEALALRTQQEIKTRAQDLITKMDLVCFPRVVGEILLTSLPG